MEISDFTNALQRQWEALTPAQRLQARPWVSGLCGVVTQAELPAGGAASQARFNAQNGGAAPEDACSLLKMIALKNNHKCGGKCEGHCDDCKSVAGACHIPPGMPNTPGTVPLLIPPGDFPGCYCCDEVDPCLYPLLVAARPDFDDWSWLELWKTEAPIVHLNKDVGLDADYQIEPPLSANQKLLYAQEDAQQLPYNPGLLKVAFGFAETPGPAAKIKLRLYAGPKGVTDIGSSEDEKKAKGLIGFARDFTLDDFICGTDCYLMEFPRLLGCRTRGIPHLRSLYVEIDAGTIGDNQLTDVSVTIIKHATREYKKCCKQYPMVVV